MVRKLAIALAIVHFSTSAVAATVNKRIVNGEPAKASDMPSINQKTGGVDAKVASKIPHPDYPAQIQKGQPHALNDIGILKLSSPIEESETIKYATLPPNGFDPAPNSTAMIAGWGTPKHVGQSPVDILNKVDVPVLSREDCRRIDAVATGDIDTIICAGGANGNLCKYDSGGPLVASETGQVIGVGAVTLERKEEPNRFRVCNEAPSLFTRVGSYIPFITENLGKPVAQQL